MVNHSQNIVTILCGSFNTLFITLFVSGFLAFLEFVVDPLCASLLHLKLEALLCSACRLHFKAKGTLENYLPKIAQQNLSMVAEDQPAKEIKIEAS